MGTGAVGSSPPDQLTDKQRAVLELLIQHKTSKEIAQILGISYYTVDQRIEAAMKKVGAPNRRELALHYAHLRPVSEQLAYEKFDLAAELATGDADRGADAEAGHADRPLAVEQQNYRVVPRVFEGPYGIYARLVAIVLAALVLLIIALAGMAVITEASQVATEFL